ncbi:MAG TPA: prolyl oligopeptidase family serine peptidase [Solirubrobacteraceae bacterium]
MFGDDVRFDARPDGAARARLTSPSLLGIADHRHAAGWWRDLRIDASVCGLATQRSQPTAVLIEHRGDRWQLPVDGVLGCGLAWNPSRPLVAGLAVHGGPAHLWIADYAERSVQTLDAVQAATSLTALDRFAVPPLCWLGDRTLAFLAARRRAEPGPPSDEPLVYEATGPGFVTFEPGIDELLSATAAAIALLDLGDETVDPLTGPLLVRRLQADDAQRLVVSHATGLRDAAGRDGLVWSAGRLDRSTRPATLAPHDGPEPRPPAPAPPLAAGHSARRAPRRSTTTRMLPTPSARHPARLAMFPQQSSSDRPAATLLWIRASRAPLDAAAPIPVPLPDTGTPIAVLDLPLHWPADATLGLLHDQIAGAVQTALHVLDADDVVAGGHSFGATLALFALANVPGLAGAIAHSGCYNRTHTPFGFQYERRRYWDVPEIYAAFSALAFADRIGGPVLIVHGLEDSNPATHPDQAVDLYRSIVATGGTAQLALLPREEHSFRYRETHQRLARIHRDWLERAAARRSGAVMSHAR